MTEKSGRFSSGHALLIAAAKSGDNDTWESVLAQLEESNAKVLPSHTRENTVATQREFGGVEFRFTITSAVPAIVLLFFILNVPRRFKGRERES